MNTPSARMPANARSGRIPVWLLLFVVLVGALAAQRELGARAEADGFAWIDPADLDPGPLPDWAHPDWSDYLAEAFDALPPFRADDPIGLERLTVTLCDLPFVRDVRDPRVVWPDGLALALELEHPVACVPAADGFLCVSEDGTLLPGWYPAPPEADGAPLAVIGPMEDAAWFAEAVEGEGLVEPRHLDGLDVALSLRAHLVLEERLRLGPVVIDATRASLASVEEPGIRLLLEDYRLCLFGRAPSAPAPGELSARTKWRSLVRALRLIGAPEGDWDLVDLRWDRAELRLRGRPEAAPATLSAFAGGV